MSKSKNSKTKNLKTKNWLVLLPVFFLASPCLAQICIPNYSHSEAYIAYTGPGTPSLLVAPDGNGNPFTWAHDEQGNVVDATVTLYLLYPDLDPVPDYPLEDLWLGTQDYGLASCMGGTVPDFNTDINGMTQWIDPLFAGGHSLDQVYVNITGFFDITPSSTLHFNSPDINGDLVVTLHDLQIFATDYFSAYQYRCDLHRDGVLNLADVSIFAQHYGVQCP